MPLHLLTMKPVDSHCHLDFEQFDSDRDEVIENCREKLEFVVTAGSNVEHNQSAIQLEKKYPEIAVSNLGLHPVYTDSFNQLEEVKQQIRENKPAAVGEIGLDYHHVTDSELRDRQEEIFREMLELAEELELPVVVHSRDAEEKAVDILKEYDIPQVMLHCFNGSPRLARDAVENGMKIGVTTQVLYSSQVQEIVEAINTEDMLLETDSPFLYQGERNEPINVIESAERIAEIKNTGVEEVVDATTRNAKELFGR